MVSFDTNILVYATAPVAEAKADRARELMVRAMRGGTSIFLLQTFAEFCNVAIRKARVATADVERTIAAWCAVLPVQAADESDLAAALAAVRTNRFSFWDAMLWASASRAGVSHLLTEDLQDGFVFQGMTFINPFLAHNNQLIDRILPPS
jgi:predicted nucleic acid-binding protein